MKAPSARARAVLERYTAATAPAGADKARLLDVIQQRATRGDLPRFDVWAAAPTLPKARLVQRVWASPLAKAGLVLAVAGWPALGVYEGHKVWPRPATQRAPLSAPLGQIGAAPPLPAVSDAAPQLMPDSPTIGSSLPHVRADKSNDAPLPSEPTIDEEVKLMNGAQAALRSGKPRQALQLLNEDARRFPKGKLASAWAVAHMIALCRLGRADEARREADRFVAKTPNSPFAERASDVCSSPRENR